MKRLYARNCIVKEIDGQTANNFLKENHLQGSDRAAEINLGLYYEDQLVQVETFGKPLIEIQNKSIKHQYELVRECSLKDYLIIGGKSKLLKHFIKEYKCLSLLSYCDADHFDGHSYYACGFKKIDEHSGYHYIKDGKEIKRYKMQKNSNLRKAGKTENIQKTIEEFGGTYFPEKSERENAELNGFIKVEDKGTLTFELITSDFVGYIYKTTNLINGKVYIGQHIANGDKYIGSGTIITKAIKKYGLSNFKIETLEWCDNRETLNEREKYWIKATVDAESINCYNIKCGGDAHSLTKEMKEKISKATKAAMAKMTEEQKEIRNKRAGATVHNLYVTGKLTQKGKKRSKEAIEKTKASLKKYYETHESPNKGKSTSKKGTTVSDDQKKRISETLKERNALMRKLLDYYNSGPAKRRPTE